MRPFVTVRNERQLFSRGRLKLPVRYRPGPAVPLSALCRRPRLSLWRPKAAFAGGGKLVQKKVLAKNHKPAMTM
ncbi:MAG: hypothetical protein LH610_00850, partial [Sphingomonas bacterium]|nr:hypothetical protein [Sphingomonas bacterium]